MPTWPVAVLSFLLGFAVADVTGVRPLGGVVLVAGAVWCARRWRPALGTPRTATLLGFALVAFVLSHALADVLGTWGAVLVTSAVVGLVAWAAADAPAGRAPLPA